MAVVALTQLSHSPNVPRTHPSEPLFFSFSMYPCPPLCPVTCIWAASQHLSHGRVPSYLPRILEHTNEPPRFFPVLLFVVIPGRLCSFNQNKTQSTKKYKLDTKHGFSPLPCWWPPGAYTRSYSPVLTSTLFSRTRPTDVGLDLDRLELQCCLPIMEAAQSLLPSTYRQSGASADPA